MSIKKISCAIIALMSFQHSMHAGFQELFDTRNRLAGRYLKAKDGVNKSFTSALSLAAAIGTFKYMRTKPGADDLSCFGKSIAFAGTTAGAMQLVPNFILDSILKRLPPLRGLYNRQDAATKELFNYAKRSGNIVDELLTFVSRGNDVEDDMHARLMDFIGNPTGKEWIDKARVTKKPEFYGDVPLEVYRAIDEIKGSDEYAELGKLGTPQAGIILAGPAGTGKTTLGKLIAFEAGTPIKAGNVSEFAHKYVGTGAHNLKKFISYCDSLAIAAHEDNLKREAEEERKREWENRSTLGYLGWRFGQSIKNAFSKAPERKIRKCVVQLDEGQGALQEHGDKYNSEDKKIVETLLQEIDKADQHHVFFVITTNSDEVNFREASLRRFGNKVVKVGLPDEKNRFNIIKGYLKDPDFIRFLDPSLRLPKKDLEGDVQNNFALIAYDYVTALKENRLEECLRDEKSKEEAALRQMCQDEEAALRQKHQDDAEVLANKIQQLNEGLANNMQELNERYQKRAQFFATHREALIYWQSVADRAKGFSGASVFLCLSNAAKLATFNFRQNLADSRTIKKDHIEDCLNDLIQVDEARRALIAKEQEKKEQALRGSGSEQRQSVNSGMPERRTTSTSASPCGIHNPVETVDGSSSRTVNGSQIPEDHTNAQRNVTLALAALNNANQHAIHNNVSQINDRVQELKRFRENCVTSPVNHKVELPATTNRAPASLRPNSEYTAVTCSRRARLVKICE